MTPCANSVSGDVFSNVRLQLLLGRPRALLASSPFTTSPLEGVGAGVFVGRVLIGVGVFVR